MCVFFFLEVFSLFLELTKLLDEPSPVDCFVRATSVVTSVVNFPRYCCAAYTEVVCIEQWTK